LSAIVEPLFVTEFRGELPAKNKGMAPMYFVHKIRPEFSQDGDGIRPNEAFEAWRNDMVEAAEASGRSARTTY